MIADSCTVFAAVAVVSAVYAIAPGLAFLVMIAGAFALVFAGGEA